MKVIRRAVEHGRQVDPGRVCQRFATGVMQTLRRRTKRTHDLRSSAVLHPWRSRRRAVFPQRLADFASLEPEHEDDGDHGVDAAMAACAQLAPPLRTRATSPREPAPDSFLLVTAFGMQLHAAVTVCGRERSRLERL